jgi:hypothetical protein
MARVIHRMQRIIFNTTDQIDTPKIRFSGMHVSMYKNDKKKTHSYVIQQHSG